MSRCPWSGETFAQEEYIYRRFVERIGQHFFLPGPLWPVWLAEGCDLLNAWRSEDQRQAEEEAAQTVLMYHNFPKG